MKVAFQLANALMHESEWTHIRIDDLDRIQFSSKNVNSDVIIRPTHENVNE